VVGFNGTLLYSTDKGNSWLLINSITNDNLYGICFYDSFKGWVARYNGVILFTSDCGKNWTKQNSGTEEVIYDVKFIDSLKGFASGSHGLLLYTRDGGNNWEKLKTNTSNNLYRIFFVDSLHGWIVGYSGTIYHTTNGGITFVEDEQVQKALSSCYPNPFSETATITYTLQEPAWVKLCIYDFLGKEVVLLVNEYQDAGEYRKTIDSTSLSKGIYYYVLKTGNRTITPKIIITY